MDVIHCLPAEVSSEVIAGPRYGPFREGHEAREPTDRDGMKVLPEAFTKNSVTLSPTPALSSVVPQTAARWKKIRTIRILALHGCLWTSVLCYFLLGSASDEEAVRSKRWLSIGLATTLATLITQIAYGDMLLYTVTKEVNSVDTAIFVAVCIVTPILIRPLSSTVQIPYPIHDPDPLVDLASIGWAGKWVLELATHSGELPRFDTPSAVSTYVDSAHYPVTHQTLRSWDSVLDTVSFGPPISQRKRLRPGLLRVERTLWPNRDADDKFTSFDLPGNGAGFDEQHLEVTSVVAAMPVKVATKHPLHKWTQSLRQAKTYVQQQYGIALECEYLVQNSDQTTQSPDGLVVSLVDSQGCSASLLLRRLEHDLDKAALALDEARERANGTFRSQKSFDRVSAVLDSYSSLLDTTSNLESFAANWYAANGANASCSRKIFIAAPAQAFYARRTALFTPEILAASCMPRYKETIGTVNASQYLGNMLQRESSHVLNPRLVEFEYIDVQYRKTPQGVTQHAQPVDAASQKEFDKLLFDYILPHSGDLDFTPGLSTRLQDELDDTYWSRPRPIGPLLMASRVFRSLFTSVVYELGAIALEENLETSECSEKCYTQHDLKPAWTGFMEALKYRPVFATTFAIWAAKLLALIGMLIGQYGCKTVVVAASLFVSIFVWDEIASLSAADLPLTRQSIATKAALLCRSQLKETLRAATHVKELGPLASKLHLGIWATDDPGARDGMRLECLHSDKGTCSAVHRAIV